MKPSRPKRHHYLPQFYLEGFSVEGRLFIYDEPRSQLRPGRATNTAVRGHYYSFINEQGGKDPSIEESLARIEGRAVPTFGALRRCQALSPEDRYNLSIFLGFLRCRTPAFERSVNEVLTGLAEVVIRKNLEEPNADKIFGAPPAELTACLESGGFELEAHPNERISQMIDFSRDLGKDFFVSNWTVLHTGAKSAFVTCDNPFAIISPNRRSNDIGFQRYGIGSPEVTTSFPLSSHECLLMSGVGGTLRHASASKEQVRRINLATIAETEELAVARDEVHLRSLIKRAGLGPARERTKLVVQNFCDPAGNPNRSVLITGRRQDSRK
jgi:hypothetical protein